MSSNVDRSHRGEDNKDNFTMMQYFEWYAEGGGKHWQKYKDDAAHLAEMGITACWIPPPTKGSSPEGTGYDIYDLWDLGEFDQKGAKPTHWGSKEDLLAAIKEAKKHKIITYIDAVLNHKAGADEKELFKASMVDRNDRMKTVSEPYDIEGWTKFVFPGRTEGGEKKDEEKKDGVANGDANGHANGDANGDAKEANGDANKGDKKEANGDAKPTDADKGKGKKAYSQMEWNFNHFTGIDYDAKTDTKAIFKIKGDGKDWASDVDTENANYDYLMFSDIDHEHPEVRDDMFKWGEWVLNETGAYGFRFDAVKHISREFIGDFVKHVREKVGSDKMFCVGEFWKDSVPALNAYLDGLGTQFSVFDTPLQGNFKEASEAGTNYDLRKIFDDTLVQSRPIDAVTLVDNHDTQIGQSLQNWVAPWFKPLAYSLILLRESGYPCVFYGDLYGCGGDNPQQGVTQLADLVRARKEFAYGDQVDYWDHANCVAWLRKGDDHHDGLVCVACNGSERGTKRVEVGKEHAGEKWSDVLGWTQGEVTIGDDGWAEFSCPAQSVAVWTKTDARGREYFKKD